MSFGRFKRCGHGRFPIANTENFDIWAESLMMIRNGNFTAKLQDWSGAGAKL